MSRNDGCAPLQLHEPAERGLFVRSRAAMRAGAPAVALIHANLAMNWQ